MNTTERNISARILMETWDGSANKVFADICKKLQREFPKAKFGIFDNPNSGLEYLLELVITSDKRTFLKAKEYCDEIIKEVI